VSRALPFFFAAALLLGAGWFALGPREAGKEAFEGDSRELRRTAFVPTLDTPLPEGKSAVWCASFQLAWDQLKADVVHGPVEITNAGEICDRLNKAGPAADDLPAEACYAAAGLEDDGIRETIRAEMARRFPHAPPPELPGSAGGILAYAYLEAEVRYEHPYLVNPKALRFQERGGKECRVGSFGIPDEDLVAECKDQAGILFAEFDEHFRHLNAFAVDLDRHSRPNQVVLARVDRKQTLTETLAEVDRRSRAYASQPGARWDQTLSFRDTLLVPNMRWKVRHRFRELLGERKFLKFDGRDWPVVAAEQTVAFRLDPRGAGVRSSADVKAGKSGPPRHLHFDQPFLLYLKKRDAERPFFVMWVENAELLCGP
jgi:hypothetical protein